MRRRASFVVIAAASAGAWLGCNALLGIESAVFEPDGGDERPLDDRDGSSADGDAGLDASDAGPCVDTLTNSRHCGACGHDCLGGACAQGKCQPAIVANDVGGGFSVAIDETHVYWTNRNTQEIKRVPKIGGAVQLLFSKPDTGLADGIFVRGGQVYFATSSMDGGVMHCPASGCGPAGPSVDVSGPVTVFDIAAGGLVSFATSSHEVNRCTLPCMNLGVPVATGEGLVLSVTSAPGLVVWSRIPLELRAREGVTPPRTIDSTAFIGQVVVTGDRLVYAQLNRGPRVALPDGGAKRDLRAATAPAVNTDHVAVDGEHVFFNDYGGSTPSGAIFECPMSGCEDGGGALAVEQPVPRGIAVDDRAIYWVTEGDADAGAIVRLAR